MGAEYHYESLTGAQGDHYAQLLDLLATALRPDKKNTFHKVQLWGEFSPSIVSVLICLE